ncbi:MAG: hypothetical protein Q8N16_02620 [bacterium]|nr:hypothetical protein [bacterium]
MFQYLVFVGAAATLFGALAYIKGTLAGRTKPNRITWLMWAVAPLIAFAAGLSDGVGWAILPVFTAGFFPLIIFLVSFVNPNAYWKLQIFDYICGLFSILALVLWAITKNPNIAIVFAIVSDAFAGMPTLIKAWQRPETESGLIYLTSAFSALTGLIAVKNWMFSEYAFNIYLFLIGVLLTGAVYHKRIIRKTYGG